ncbi:Flowering-promoting factor 1-like protein 2 [Trifolium repens]|nr:Flowering-promoting factor 1-like protein 2 [Trifolium repens]
MSGVWVFNKGVFRLVENPQAEASEGRHGKRKMLVHLPTGEVHSFTWQHILDYVCFMTIWKSQFNTY